jgi:malate synthase
MKTIEREVGQPRFQAGRFREARALFERISTAQSLENFLTLPAYEALDRGSAESAKDHSR